MSKPLIPMRVNRRTSLPQFRGGPTHRWLDSCQRLVTFFALISIIFGMTYLPSLYMRHLKPVAFVWPANQTRDAYEMILPNVSTNLVASLCTPTSSSGQSSAKSSAAPVLVVVICSAVRNFEARRAIRTTWAQKDLVPPGVRIVFLLGRGQNFTGQNSVIREAKEFGDIVQENFLDSYANLTIKSLMMLKWYTQNCDKVPYLLKTDDDMYINLKNLHQILLANQKPNLLLGNLICGAKPIRDPYNKWFAPEYLYDSEYYPNYLSGTAYVLSRSTAKIFLEAAGSVPLFHMEDIYITGCLARFVGIRPEDHRGFSYEKRAILPCLYSQVISSHQVTPAEMKLVAAKLRRPLQCRPLKPAQLRSFGTGKCKWKR
ncbi:hypothetical protein TCAL_05625 [Tigriopus californicus]|uniref:Hexosyltransferase n=1 Tax=Tigriopus californicus TaxID=6832 RepID=A0A553NSQ1_TIGCA|nr:beta-1,3-galactosyltransferase 1-like [Tigriopus californicus]TRY68439.1 hypothetical protein TCAL_05625 [Tigriopus californicus]